MKAVESLNPSFTNDSEQIRRNKTFQKILHHKKNGKNSTESSHPNYKIFYAHEASTPSFMWIINNVLKST